ncbi:MAG: AraC family transcriptional regulator, partial [Flavitalea sp.]
SSAGQKSISELSEHSFWSSRQINRYFNDWFGLSLKAYCNILRFRESFTEISKGNLYPSQNYSDQAHFIKDVKKFAGVTPGELNRTDQGKYIQISTLKTG